MNSEIAAQLQKIAEQDQIRATIPHYKRAQAKNIQAKPEGYAHKKCPVCGSKLWINPVYPFSGCLCGAAFLIEEAANKQYDIHYIHLSLL